MAKNMEQPPADDRSHYSKKRIQNHALSMVINNVARHKTSHQTE